MAANYVQFVLRCCRTSLRMLLSPAALRAIAVLLAATALVAVVACTGEWLTVQQLAGRIRASDDSTAGRLVAELAAFGDTAYPVLVVAANSQRSAVALSARGEVDAIVEQWQQSAYLHPATFDLGRGALPLATTLDEQLPSMNASGRRWARRVLSSLLDLAQQQGFRERIELIRVCDKALSSLPPDEPTLQFEPDVDYHLTLAPPPDSSPLESQIVEEPRTVSPPPSVNPTVPPLSAAAETGASATRDQVAPAPLANPKSHLSEWDPNWNATQIESGATAQPIDRVPAHSASTRLAPPPTSIEAGDPALEVRDVPHINDRTEEVLFKLLASGDTARQTAAAEELLLRGYGRATPLDARMLLSASAADRIAMVDLAMTSTRLESRKWLWRLAHDPSGEVRAAAVSAISTSGDRELIEATLDLAIRDRDPRVAKHAEALQKLLR